MQFYLKHHGREVEVSCYQSRMTNGFVARSGSSKKREREKQRKRERKKEKKESVGRSQRRTKDDCHSHYRPVDVIIYDVVNLGAKIHLVCALIQPPRHDAMRRLSLSPSIWRCAHKYELPKIVLLMLWHSSLERSSISLSSNRAELSNFLPPFSSILLESKICWMLREKHTTLVYLYYHTVFTLFCSWNEFKDILRRY